MHAIAFADAVRPATVVCLRLPLLPYSVGHEIILLQQRNPLLLLPRPEFDQLSFAQQRQAIIRAVLVCSNNWSQNHKRQRWLRVWGWTLWSIDWTLALADLRNYLTAGHAAFPGPDMEADAVCAKSTGYQPLRESRGRASGSPLVARLLNFIIKHPSVISPRSSLYDTSFALANMLYEAALESEGAARIENIEEFEEKENLQTLHREMDAERAERLKNNPEPAAEPAKSADGLATPPPDLSGVDSQPSTPNSQL